MCDEGRGVGPMVGDFRRGVYLDFADAIERLGEDAVREKYDNLFDMYERITGENPYQVPMRIYPAVHYVMGGLWVDYDLQSSITGLFVTGEANFSDHGANRLGASALMQGLADGYFVLPHTLRDYLAEGPFEEIDEDHPAVVEARDGRPGADREVPLDQRQPLRRQLPPRARPHHVGVLRHGAQRRGPAQGDRHDPRAQARVLDRPQGARHRRHPQPEPREGRPGGRLHRARRADVHRRAQPARVLRRPLPRESQTEDGEALRHDDEFAYVAAWEWAGEDETPVLHKEDLAYTAIEMKQRSYK